LSSEKDYWVNAKELTEDELSDRSTSILVEINRAAWISKDSAKRACEFLFGLSNTALPDVRGNYFWPSAYAEVLRRSQRRDQPPTQPRFERYFRDALGKAFGRELERLERHGIRNKYIAVVFKQAGIGKDRNQILKGYLEFLVDRFSLNSADGIHSEASHSIAARALKEYLQTVPEAVRQDVHFFSAVLVRLGSEILVLAHTIETDPNRADAADWSWGELRNFWIHRTGIDLEELTPSASHVLFGLVGSLSKQWLRRDIFRLGKTGSISLHLPDGHTLGQSRNYRDIPIGPAELSVKGRRQLIKITDRKELTSDFLARSERDVWHWLDDDYAFKVSTSPFVGTNPGAFPQPAVPFYGGETPESARRLGFFLGGVFEQGVVPESSLAPHRSFLKPHIGFGWRHDRLFLEIRGFATSLPDNGACTLAIGGREVWKGAVRLGRPEGMRRHWVDVGRLSADCSTLEATLTCDRDESIRTAISVWPHSDGVFLVVGRKAYRSGSRIQLWQVGSGSFQDIRLVSSEPEQKLHLENLDAKGTSSVSAGERVYSITLLTIKSPRQASIRFGDALWILDCRPAVALCYADPDDYPEINGVRISGTGNISIVRALPQLRLRSDCPQAFDDRSIGFWINTPGSELFCDVAPNDWSKDDSGSILCLCRLMERNGLDLPYGAIGFVLGTQSSRSSRVFNFFVAPEAISIEITRFGERSRLTLGTRDCVATIASNEDVTPLIFDERKLISGCLKGADWDIWFRWQPLVFDWTINGEIGMPCNYEYSLHSESFKRANRELVGRLSTREEGVIATIGIADDPTVRFGTAPADLWELLARDEKLNRLDKVEIVATQGARHVAWTLNLKPVLDSVNCSAVNQIADQLELRAEVALFGYRRGELTICCVSDSTVLEQRPFVVSASQRPVLSSTEVGFAICLPPQDRIHLEILVLWNGEELGRSTVVYPDSILNSGQQEPSLREAIESYKRTGAPALLPAILRNLITTVAYSPAKAFRVGNVMTGIAGHGEATDESWLNLGLNCLAQLRSDRPRYLHFPPELPKSQKLETTVCALWLLLAARYAAQGQMNPEHYVLAMDHVTSLLNSGSINNCWEGNFAELVCGFASGIPSRYALGSGLFRPEAVTEASLSGSAEQMILEAISSEYKNRQETV